MKYRKIKVGQKYVEAVSISLQSKNFILIRGRLGYIMCGYLNLKIAEKFKDAAVKITGVATINDALKAKVFALTSSAKKLGVYKNQPIKEVIKIIA